MNLRRHTFLLLGCLLSLVTFAQSGNIEFIENKGQWNTAVRFMGRLANGAFFVHPNGFTVVQQKAEDLEALSQLTHGHGADLVTATDNGSGMQAAAAHPELAPRRSVTVHSHAYRVEFIGANPAAQIIPDKPLFTYSNYFIGNDPSKWASGCRTFQAVTVKDIYPNIDIRYYSNNGLMKYDIIIKPGGNVADIALKYTGADGLSIKNKELLIHTSVGLLKERDPYTYQYDLQGRKTVKAAYVLKDSVVRFKIAAYDPASVLTIDPAVIFCSFSGSTSDNWGYTATYGPDGSMYGGGIVFGTGFPVSTGAYQTTYGGGTGGEAIDMGIIRLSPDGTNRIFATYIGGSGNEQPHSLVVDAQGNVVIAGRSSSANYPVTGTGLIGPGGGNDIVVTKISANGTTLIGSKRIGGKADDGANIRADHGSSSNSILQNYGDDGRSEVILDGAGNIYVASCTQSADFPISGGFQASSGGKQDAVVLKLDPSVSILLFSSYLGGSGNDAAYVLALNPADNSIYVGGGTESTNFTGPTSGAVYPTARGSIDGFVCRITNDGSAVIRTTYMGTDTVDQVYGVQFDNNGFVYVMGQTRGVFPVQNAAWSEPGGGQFIAKLQPDLSAFVYSTTFGTNGRRPNISPTAFLVDRCENVYVSGWGCGTDAYFKNFLAGGTTGLTVTPDANKPTTDGNDFYFFVLKKDAVSQLYGSFFGQTGGFGDHVDGGTSRFDKNGVIYQGVCANCGGGVPFPTTPGAWSQINGARGSKACNLAMVKIAFNFDGVRGKIQSLINNAIDTTGCIGVDIQFRDSIQIAQSYEWYFNDGSLPSPVKTVDPFLNHTFTRTGTYRVMMVAVDLTKCIQRDTSYITMIISDAFAKLDFTPVKLDPCTQFKYRFDNTSTAPATVPFAGQAFEWDFGDNTAKVKAGTESVFHDYAAPGTYNVKLRLLDDRYCNYPDSVVKQVRVSSLVKARFVTAASGCAPYLPLINNTSDAGSTFIWQYTDGYEETALTPTRVLPVGTYQLRLIAIDPATCNGRDTSGYFTITVLEKPTAGFTAAPQPPTTNTPISFTNTSSADAVRFKWLFGDGDSLLTTSRAVIRHEYNSSNTYSACLVAYNQLGCPDTACHTVTTLVVPALDVPNAFTPLVGGINGTIHVRGYGIAKMKFTIYSRIGEKVFESENKASGWDGRFKGKLMPMDVYAYTLNAEFTDGTKTTKTGDITLIR